MVPKNGPARDLERFMVRDLARLKARHVKFTNPLKAGLVIGSLVDGRGGSRNRASLPELRDTGGRYSTERLSFN